MPERSPLAIRLRQRLAAAASPAGGWPYYAGKQSRIEPTAWVLLALADAWDDGATAWQQFAAPHLGFLESLQHPDGLLIEHPSAPPNLAANGLAACVLAHLPAGGATGVLSRLLDGIVLVKGLSVNAPDPRQDNTLLGWPWIPDTFSWVEPTSWCALALKKTRNVRNAAARIDEADRLLVNRSCEAGGWNYGNASALGQDLRPYVPTTALGLIALQDRRTQSVVATVDRGLAYLTGARMMEPSATALSLTALCLRLYGRPVDDVESRLTADADRAEQVGNLHALAMMLHATTAAQHEARAFRV